MGLERYDIVPNPMASDFSLDLTASLRRMGLAEPGEQPAYTSMADGVASDIWRVDLRRGTICVKRALSKLRVRSDWTVPVERWRYEVAWIRTVGSIVPHAVPQLLGKDEAGQLFAMEFLDPSIYRSWKSELKNGRGEKDTASAVGSLLAKIHGSTADRADIAAAFQTDAIFGAIRLDPYLEATAQRHPDLATNLREIIRVTATTKRALVHGDISPKNILLGPKGPVFIDAECAWYGDPAFDIAFCLNHMLLKCLLAPKAATLFLECFDSLRDAYLEGVTWEPKTEIDQRAAALLAGLFLARVDGKSPVEYVTEERDKNLVRNVGRALITSPPPSLAAARRAWAQELGLA